jgi:hypothetical protein
VLLSFVAGPTWRTGEFGVRYTKSTLQAKMFLVLATPALAYAAEQKIHQLDSITDIGIWTWAFILLFSTLGWAVKDLDRLAEWWDEEERILKDIVKARLGVIKGIAASNSAGIGTYLIGNVAPGWLEMKNPVPEMALFVLITIAGYWGARWFDTFGQKFFGGSSSGGGSDSGPPTPPNVPRGPYSKD